MTETRDCVVIGGGPAGSTFAAIVGKYAPHLSVTVLEKDKFPRWHIGESTIPVANGILRDLGIYDELVESTHIQKIGAVFIWGKNREPWNIEFLELDGLEIGALSTDTIDVTGQDFGSLIDNLHQPDKPFLSFNVRRAEFDDMLLNKAREFGADVREETRATEVVKDDRGRVVAVKWRDRSGNSGTIDTPFVLDAAGLNAMMTRNNRERDPNMNNFAAFGYLSGAEWKVTYNGTHEYTTLFVSSIEKGWIWYFPVGDDVMSVGVVTNNAHFKDRLKNIDLESFFWESLESCPELRELVRPAKLRDDILPGGKKVGACQDWSSRAREFIGDGWAAAGDAAVFIDPVLASGLTVAIMTGHRAAYTFITQHKRPDIDASGLWRAYADFLRGEAAAFLKLSRYFYANNKSVESWWWEAQTLINQSGRLDLGDRQAFALATAGFFPTPRAISPEVMGPLFTNLFGADVDSNEVDGDAHVPAIDEIAACRMEILTRFRLDIQTEPAIKGNTPGELEVYHDLVPEDPEFDHRLAASPCKIPPPWHRLSKPCRVTIWSRHCWKKRRHCSRRAAPVEMPLARRRST